MPHKKIGDYQSLVTEAQVRKLMEEFSKTGGIGQAAMKAGMDRGTASKSDLSSANADVNLRLRRRRRFVEPPIEAPKGPMSIHQGRQAWDEYARRFQRAGRPVPPNPYRHLDRSGS